MNKNNFGYPSKEPCEVCGIHNNNQSEPRFGFTVCEDHQGIPPIDINKYQKAKCDLTNINLKDYIN